MAGTATCNYCKTQIDIPDGYNRPFIPCPQCKRMVTITSSPRPSGPPPARPAAPSVPSPAHAVPPLQPLSGAPGEALPELMKANKLVLGKTCAVCARPIALGEQIHNCPSCHSVNHDACWTKSGGCPSPSCSSSRRGHPSDGLGSPLPGMAMGGAGAPPPGGSVPCRWCKEPIARGARKCKHCNEYQSDEDRATFSGQANPAAGADAVMLSTTDWIGVLCCPIIGLLQGLIYVAQGNPKGQRLILYSAIALAIGGVLNAIGGKH